jgi:Nickel responsive protein SCO4226-like
VTTYLVEGYVPGGDIADLQDRACATAAAMSSEGHTVRYLRSVVVRSDETCFHLFEAASEDVVAELARRAKFGYERIVEAEEHQSDRAQRRQTSAIAPLKGGLR